MSISDVSIRNPVMAWMLMAALIVFGGISFMRMGVSQLPDVDFPMLNISADLDGAAPEIMESEVVDPLEDAVMSVQGLKSLSSTARNGSANVSLEFEIGIDIDVALQEVQSKLAQVTRKLPRDIQGPSISKFNPEDQPILWLAVESDKMPARELMAYVRDQLRDQFVTVSGVGDVFLGGYVEPNLRVWVSSEKLQRYQLAVGDVINTIANEHSELPAGNLSDAKREVNVRTLGEAKSVDEFQQLLINTRGGQPNYTPIRLKDVARVEEGLAEVRRISRGAGGKNAVGLGIRKQRGVNAVSVAKAVKAKALTVGASLPEGTTIRTRFDSTVFIEESIHELNFTLVLSAILTALVCWFFLGSWSSTFNILLAIPTSVVGTFIVLAAAGFTLNLFTLLALSLSIGIVVDDAIMVLENIIRHREMGKEKRRAAEEGAREITFAALAATLSIVAIFLPVAFMKGIIGQYFFQFGVAMSVAVLLSLLEALTLTPMRCASFVDTNERHDRLGKAIEAGLRRVTQAYARTLALALEHRWKTLIFSVLFFGASVYTGKYIGREFAPAQDQSSFMLRVRTPIGSSLQFTDETFKQVEAFLNQRSEVAGYFASIGGFGGGEVNTGMVFVTMHPRGKRGIAPGNKAELGQHEFMDVIRKELKVKDARITVQDTSMRGFSSGRGYPVEFTLRGPEWEELSRVSQSVMAELEKSGMLRDVDSDYKEGMPELRIIPDRERASQRGVSVASIGQSVSALIGGQVVGRYFTGGRRYDIRVKIDESTGPAGMDKRELIKNLTVRNNRGELIPLADLVKLEERPSLQAITRQDRARAISVYANLAPGASQEKALALAQQVAKRQLKAGYSFHLSGSSQSMQETFQSLIFALVLGILVAYMILASQFNSFLDPFIVLLSMPFSFSGAFLALLAWGQTLNMFSFIGLLLLMGIVKKNSILLVDFTRQVRLDGEQDITQALLKACPTRLRPILMTSLATVVGALPLAFGLAPGAESRKPMGVVIVGGVLVSTLLTLYVVPCAYRIMSRKIRV